MTREPLDLRLAPAAVAAWSASAVGLGWSPGRAALGTVVLLAAGAALLVLDRRSAARHGRYVLAAAAVIVAAGALGVAGLRAGSVQSGPVPALAGEAAYVEVSGTVSSDPVRREGEFGTYVLVRLDIREVTGRGVTTGVRSPALVIADHAWMNADLGDAVDAEGRLQASQTRDLSGVLIARGPPLVTDQSGYVDRAVARVRAGVVEASSPLPAAERALIPALVDGDDSAMPAEVAEDFRTAGLTHLLAVSGTNLTLVLGFVLLAARWCGVRSYGLTLVGVGAVVFFVLLARPEPSVVRAAAMGVVGLAGLSTGGRRRGVRALCVAVVVLVLLEPWLARSVGFLLSALATGGILVLAPGWRDILSRWMPRPLAEAVAVPLAAQIVCTPVVAALSSQVSLVAVLANLLVAPAVGPATVLGLAGGLLAVGSDTLGHLVGYLAEVPAWWIVTVAERSARLGGASIGWPAEAVGLVVLGAICLGVVLVLPVLLRRPRVCVVTVVALAAVLIQPWGRPGWPPEGWVAVMCDVGQGDAIVLNAGAGVAVVVDAGPDPRAVDGCLDDLGVHRVALVVLTHFHADHVDGLPGVLDGRLVAEVQVSPLEDPPSGAASVADATAAAKVPTTVAVLGERRRVGLLRWRVIGPVDVPDVTADGTGEEGSAPNNASVVMMVQTQGLRLLLTGDAEPEEEADILRSGVDLEADVFKVAHHGSANQDPDFLAAARPRVALVSVGADNEYGHPSSQTLAILERLGTDVHRTDEEGDLALVRRAGGLVVVAEDG